MAVAGRSDITKSVIQRLYCCADWWYFNKCEDEDAVYEYLKDGLPLSYNAQADDRFENHIDVEQLKIYPNIPIVNEAFDKNNETPLLKGNKWILTTWDYSEGTWQELDIYDDDFAWTGSECHTFEYYCNKFPETHLKKENYEHKSFLESDEEKTQKLLNNFTYEDICKYFKYIYEIGRITKEDIRNDLSFLFEDKNDIDSCKTK